MAAKAKTTRSKAQTAASRKAAAAGRASQASVRAAYKTSHHGSPPPRTKSQHAASVRAAAAGRAAQAARRQGKPYVSKAKPKAPAPGTWTAPLDLHALPVCGPVAVAAHHAVFTGGFMPDEDVLALAKIVQDATMADLLEYVRAEGFPGSGEKLAHFEQCDPGYEVPGLVYGLQLPQGYHAVLAHPGRAGAGAVSWGLLVPWCQLLHDGAAPAEAWWLEWEAE